MVKQPAKCCRSSTIIVQNKLIVRVWANIVCTGDMDCHGGRKLIYFQAMGDRALVCRAPWCADELKPGAAHNTLACVTVDIDIPCVSYLAHVVASPGSRALFSLNSLARGGIAVLSGASHALRLVQQEQRTFRL